MAVEFFDGLGGQGNFRHQDDGLPPVLQGPVDELHKDLGFAAPRHPKEQSGGAVPAAVDRLQLLRRPLLLGGKSDGLPSPGALGLLVGVPVGLLQVIDPAAGLHKVIHHTLGDPGEVADFLYRGAARLLQQLQNSLLLGGEEGPFPVRAQPHHLELLVLHPALQKVLAEDEAPLLQAPEGRMPPDKAQSLQQLLLRRGIFARPQIIQYLPFLRGKGFPLRPPAEGEGGLGFHPVSPRQQHLHPVEPGAEGFPPQPPQQLEHLPVQHRLQVGGGCNFLYTGGQLSLRDLFGLQHQPQPLGCLPPAKGHHYPLSGGQRHPRRDPVIIELIKVVGGVFHRHLCHKRQSAAPFATVECRPVSASGR